MSTEATPNNRDAAVAATTPQPPAVAKHAPTEQQQSQAGVPRRFAPGQTVCNVKNEKGKLCNGHLKQTRTGGEDAEKHLRGDDVLFQCQSCGAIYMGPPLGHLRDPDKQQRFVEKDLAAILRAAGGTLPFYPTAGQSAPSAKSKAAAPARASTTATATPASSSSAPSATPSAPTTDAASTETPEQKRRRLARVVAEAKQRAGKPLTPEQEELLREAPTPPPAGVAAPPRAATPKAAATPVAGSSASADAHRPAAEAQAATGQASAAPMSPAAATASPAAGAETVADLAPDASTELTPGAPRAATPKQASGASGKGIPPPPPHLAPPPGETHEEKIARLRLVVAEAKARAGKE